MQYIVWTHNSGFAPIAVKATIDDAHQQYVFTSI